MQILNFLCPRDKRQGALCFAAVRLSVSPLKSLCTQLLPEFSSNYFETLHIHYKHFEDVHVNFCRQKIVFNDGIFDLDNFEVSLQHRVASLCNQLLPGLSSNQFET